MFSKIFFGLANFFLALMPEVLYNLFIDLLESKMSLNPVWFINKKFWVPRKHAELVQDLLLSVPELGYDFVTKKSKVKKKFHKSTKFVAFFVNFNGGIDHYEVNSTDTQDDQAWLEFKVEPETEYDYKKLLVMSGNSL